MKMIIVGASGTMGSFLSKAFEKENEIVRADRPSQSKTCTKQLANLTH